MTQRIKNKIYQKFIQSKKEKLFLEYSKRNADINIEIDEAKISFYKNKFQKNNETKAIWNNIKKIIPKDRESNDINTIKYNNEIISNGKDISNIFNEYYCEISKRLLENDKIKSDEYKKYLKNGQIHTIFLYKIEKEELKKELNS